MDEATLVILAGLGVLAWLLAGGWPHVWGRYVADDGPLGIGAGITAVCPGCARTGAPAMDARVATRAAAGRRTAVATGTGTSRAPAIRPLRPYAVGRDESLRVECSACGAVYTVLGVPSAVLPAPRGRTGD